MMKFLSSLIFACYIHDYSCCQVACLIILLSKNSCGYTFNHLVFCWIKPKNIFCPFSKHIFKITQCGFSPGDFTHVGENSCPDLLLIFQ